MRKFKSVFVEGNTLDNVYFSMLYELEQHGRMNPIHSGSYEGASRLEFDFIAGTIHMPTIRPLAPTFPAGVPPVTTDEKIEEYFTNYIMDGKNLEGNEHYRYATWINGGLYKIPRLRIVDEWWSGKNDELLKNEDYHFKFDGYRVNVPSQLEWIIKHYKEKGFGNNHCYITVGYPESSFSYDMPYKDESERQTSPCVLPETRILTNKGYIKAVDIKIGDIVLTHKSNWKKITKVYKREYKGNICNIRMRGFNENLKLTIDHPINIVKSVYCPYDKTEKLKCKPNCGKQYSCYEKHGKMCKKSYNEYKTEWIDAKNVNNLSYIPFPRIKIIEECEYSKDEMYLFGLFLAEGDYVNGIRFNLGSHENEIIEKVRKLMKSVYGLESHEKLSNEGDSCIRMSFYSMDLKRKYMSLFGSGVRNKDIPMVFLNYGKDYLIELLNGYVDGDGYVRKTNEKSFFTSSLNLKDKFLLILNKIGYTFTSTKVNVKNSMINGRVIKSNGCGYNIEIKENKKHNIFWADDNYVYYPIHYNKIEYYNGYVYNYEVEDDNSYIANNIPVHNCLRGIDTHVKKHNDEWYLCAHAYFRSWDLFAAWPENLGGITLLMEYIADHLGVKVGSLSFSSLKGHCYDFEIMPLKAKLNKD